MDLPELSKLYNPGYQVFIYDRKGNKYDVTKDIIEGSVTLNYNEASTATIVLQNFKDKYKDHAILKINNVIEIKMTRDTKSINFVPVFKGYISTISKNARYGTPITITALCRLKLMIIKYIDPYIDPEKYFKQLPNKILYQLAKDAGFKDSEIKIDQYTKSELDWMANAEAIWRSNHPIPADRVGTNYENITPSPTHGYNQIIVDQPTQKEILLKIKEICSVSTEYLNVCPYIAGIIQAESSFKIYAFNCETCKDDSHKHNSDYHMGKERTHIIHVGLMQLGYAATKDVGFESLFPWDMYGNYESNLKVGIHYFVEKCYAPVKSRTDTIQRAIYSFRWGPAAGKSAKESVVVNDKYVQKVMSYANQFASTYGWQFERLTNNDTSSNDSNDNGVWHNIPRGIY